MRSAYGTNSDRICRNSCDGDRAADERHIVFAMDVGAFAQLTNGNRTCGIGECVRAAMRSIIVFAMDVSAIAFVQLESAIATAIITQTIVHKRMSGIDRERAIALFDERSRKFSSTYHR